MKKKINVSIRTLSSWEIEGKIEDTIKLFQGIIKSNPGYSDIIVDVGIESGYYWHNHTSIIIRGDRLETDEEYNFRMDREAKVQKEKQRTSIANKKAAEKREKTLYERLKKKFG